MTSLQATRDLDTHSALRNGLKRLAEELSVLASALLSPGKIVAEVQEMRALQLEADRIEATQPVRAALLRRRAAQL